MWKSVTQRWVLCQFFWVIIYLMPTTLQNLYWMRMFISRGWRSHYVKNKWRTRDRKTILSKSQRPPSDLQGPAWSICFWHSFFTILHFAYSASVTQSSLLFFEQTRRVPTGFLLFFFSEMLFPQIYEWLPPLFKSLPKCHLLNDACPNLLSKIAFVPPPAPLVLLLYTIALNTV